MTEAPGCAAPGDLTLGKSVFRERARRHREPSPDHVSEHDHAGGTYLQLRNVPKQGLTLRSTVEESGTSRFHWSLRGPSGDRASRPRPFSRWFHDVPTLRNSPNKEHSARKEKFRTKLLTSTTNSFSAPWVRLAVPRPGRSTPCPTPHTDRTSRKDQCFWVPSRVGIASVVHLRSAPRSSGPSPALADWS